MGQDDRNVKEKLRDMESKMERSKICVIGDKVLDIRLYVSIDCVTLKNG